MKRKEEISIITESLLENELIESEKMDRVRGVIAEALKKIRIRKYGEKKVGKYPITKRRKVTQELVKKTVKAKIKS